MAAIPRGRDRARRLSGLVEAARLLPVERRGAFLDAVCAGDAPLRTLLESLIARAETPVEARDRWQRVSAVFDAALDLPPADRDAFLDEACAGAPDVRLEVATLLAHAGDAGFLEQTAPDPHAGRQVGDYLIERLVGAGGMGRVYRARDLRLGRIAAVKAVNPDLSHDPRARDRLRQEAQNVARLPVDPHIAVVYALIEDGDEVFYASEFVEGPTLEALLESGPLPHEALLRVFLDIARGLETAHRHGIVHRDLKPGNVMLPDAGGAKIVDFGLAKLIADRPDSGTQMVTHPGTRAGTPAYMAPEQIDPAPGAETDFRADVFALGIMLYEAATGVHPFQGRSPISTLSRILSSEPVPLSERAGPDHTGLQAVVDRCLRKDPRERYASTGALVDDLRALAEVPPRHPAPAPAPTPAPSSERAARWWWCFHQRTVAGVYGLALVPLWFVHRLVDPVWLGRGVFFLSLAATVAVVAWRLFLAFAAERYQPAQLDEQRARLGPWVRAADWLFALALLALAGAMIGADRHGAAALLVVVAVGCLVTFLVIEPATAAEAFPRRARDEDRAGT